MYRLSFSIISENYCLRIHKFGCLKFKYILTILICVGVRKFYEIGYIKAYIIYLKQIITRHIDLLHIKPEK